MAYAYCKCGEEYDFPTKEEILKGKIPCWNCDRSHPLDEDSKDDLLVDMLERLEHLESLLAVNNQS